MYTFGYENVGDVLQRNWCRCADEGGRKSVRKVLKKDDERITKDKECIHCEKFFECDGKPAKVKLCVNFVGRKEEDGRR